MYVLQALFSFFIKNNLWDSLCNLHTNKLTLWLPNAGKNPIYYVLYTFWYPNSLHYLLVNTILVLMFTTIQNGVSNFGLNDEQSDPLPLLSQTCTGPILAPRILRGPTHWEDLLKGGPCCLSFWLDFAVCTPQDIIDAVWPTANPLAQKVNGTKWLKVQNTHTKMEQYTLHNRESQFVMDLVRIFFVFHAHLFPRLYVFP